VLQRKERRIRKNESKEEWNKAGGKKTGGFEMNYEKDPRREQK
jgi:hypothetical protein